MDNKRKISRIICENRFVNSLVFGLTTGLWNRYYAENLDFVWTQFQVLVMFLVGYIVNVIAVNHHSFRKWVFYNRNIIGFIVKIFDGLSIVLFTIMKNPIPLFIGDMIVGVVVIIEDIGWTEMHSATFSGNFRAEHSARNLKAGNLGSMIAYVISTLVAIFIVGSKPISEDLLLSTQWLMLIVTFIIYVRTVKIFKLSRNLVETMWKSKNEKAA